MAGQGAANAAKTHCPKGHEYSPDNLLTADLKRGRRGCRKCHNQQALDAKAARQGKE